MAVASHFRTDTSHRVATVDQAGSAAGDDGVISVLLVEDDAPTRDFLAASLAAGDGIVLQASAGTLAEARAALERGRPRVLVTDLKLPDGHGSDLIREVRQRMPETEIMVISVLGDELSVMQAVRAGASGYILKDARPIDLIAAVRDLTNGRSPISASIARHIIRQTQAVPPAMAEEPAPALTPREMDILWGIAKGFTYNDIAARLGISRQTVPSHIKNIYRKLEVNSRSEAVYTAVERKIIKLSD
ncbi:response regulator transcription factor [Azospirillum sp. YIM B02556]|uniref:Response regulator transcription factor n=1 Tax=Azospirillum endophyticum TaxID=2800326 RepID=A0ABS1FFY7_9PROT|nr:response regulator transcription factor [Azospirillum endophyticum]MBK1842307.1 response regulator transcription factor [Azospirillum endophyticum]